MQTDPIGYDDDFNLYAYVGNDPLNRSDPTGKMAQACALNPGACARAVVATTRFVIAAGAAIAATPVVINLADAIGDAVSSAMKNEQESTSQSEGNPEQSDSGTDTQGNTNPYEGPVSSPVTVVDSNGNAIPVSTGEQVSTSPDGDYQQVRDRNGNETGVRLDRGGHRTSSDPVARGPHGHVPGVTQSDGNPHLPIKCPNQAGDC